MHYRRAKINGATYFFTVVTHDRKPFLCQPENVKLLRQALRSTMERHPIEIDAFVLLPDHLHTIWTLPDDDHDFSTRWRQIKSYFTRHCQTTFERAAATSRKTKNERAFWQRRFWEHTVKDTQDYINHVEYIHYNPSSTAWLPPQRIGNTPASTATSKPAYTTRTAGSKERIATAIVFCRSS